MIKEFDYRFDQLNIVPADIEELLALDNNEIPEPFPTLVKKGLSDAPDYCEIKGGIKIIQSVVSDNQKGTLKIGNQLFLPAKIVMLQLKNATSIAVFACTAGSGISDYAKSVSEKGDLMFGYVLDVIGSVIVEKAMRKIESELESDLNKAELYNSDCFSPGYCEWNVSEQQKLFNLLPKGFCGITLSGSSLMNPIKSVSGIIGIGPEMKKKGYQCYWCNDANCIYGKRNRSKMNKKVV
jgi:hypothetical protein